MTGSANNPTEEAIRAAVRQLARATQGRPLQGMPQDLFAQATGDIGGFVEAVPPLQAAAADVSSMAVRVAEAVLFTSTVPLSAAEVAATLPDGADVGAVLSALRRSYEGRGVQLVEVAGKWRFQTAADLGWLLRAEKPPTVKLTRSALETLAVIAYHQPVTRAEIERVRGFAASRQTMELLLELDLVRPRGRRRTPGKPLTYGTTERFLQHFGLQSLDALPGRDDLNAMGLLDAGLDAPRPEAGASADEDPLDPADAADFHVDFIGSGLEDVAKEGETADFAEPTTPLPNQED
jgi:segregation and condensation protein B